MFSQALQSLIEHEVDMPMDQEGESLLGSARDKLSQRR
jgi:hypothetical protein